MKPKLLLSVKQNGHIYHAAFTACGTEVTAQYLPEISTEYDGLVLCGGDDLDPKYYAQTNTACGPIDPDRDAAEWALLDAFVKAGKPVMGICRGHQILNVALGGTLIQDLKDDCPTQLAHEAMYAEGKNTHPVCAVSDSLLCQLFGKEFHTNSHHHQAVKTCGEGLRITVTTKDGLAEAIEHEQLPIFSVQWHPERMIGEENLELPNMMPLFEHFIALCKK
jgi:putative glutamine amidotransferase